MHNEDIDPITLEIWWSRLIAIADESATALLRTAFTTIIRESNDYATALMNADGDTLAECSGGIPAFAGLLGTTTRSFLAKFPAREWQPGDCVITNDPWLAAGHLPDIAMVTPVFYEGRLVGFTGSVAHSADIGGSLGAENQELFEEGICIPPMRLYRAGERNEAMLELFLKNVRLPKLVLGDLEAQLTANQVCRQRAIEFLQDTGLKDFQHLSHIVHLKAEQAMRRAIEAIPDGVYRAGVDADGFDHQPTHIECTVTVAGSEMTLDYAGTSRQINRGINCVLNYTKAYSLYPVKCLLDPRTRRNAGSYRPIKVTAPAGTIVNPNYPAPVAARHLTGHILCCAIYQALSQVIPDRVIADSGGAPAMRARFSGLDAQGGRYTLALFASAGMGASPRRDGLSATAFPTNSGAGSVEALESVSSLLFKKKELRVDSGGAGRFRGGLGQEIEVQNISSTPIQMTITGDREKHPALGILGGQAGAVASARLDNGKTPRLKSKTPIEPGASATLYFAGGGGYGPPEERSLDAIAYDIRNGYTTLEQARKDYGARVDAIASR
ncbi:hydantoinase B/oxoprolinase family protein [Pigmentiphaga soli]|uniref:Hydantoinase B/oxoprolinase family protein n=1 Tax=Pigmentiphaga soli TaxID=1007095 RepID=A0ABP8GQH0_9BURK